MAVSLKDVAQQAGVSDVTVSLALRNHPRISPARRQQIRQIAKQLGYTPNPLARGLRGERTQSIGVLWSLDSSRSGEGAARGIALRAQHRGYVTYIADHLADPTVIVKLLTQMQQRGVDAVVLQDSWPCIVKRYPEVFDLLRSFAAAVVVLRESHELPFGTIVHDRYTPLRETIDYLLSTGRRRIAYLSGSMTGGNDDKIVTLRQYLTARGEAFDDGSAIHVDLRSSGAMHAELTRRFARAFPFDAVLCDNDDTAMAAMDWLIERGHRIPQDVAVVGFNDSLFSQFARPHLASVAREEGRLGELIEAMLLEQLKDQDAAPRHEHLPMRFVWRESAGVRPPAGPDSS